MDSKQILKTSQEQAVAAWVNHLNQLRLNELLAKLASQDINLEQALAELQKMKLDIASLIESNRGGAKGLHGYIAEAAETGIVNAKRLIEGFMPIYEWLNNNGPVDLCRTRWGYSSDGSVFWAGYTNIQQKFVSAGGHFGLEAIKAHLQNNPGFLEGDGKYQIPKDFYEQLQRLLSLSQEEAAKKTTETYRLWKWVNTFFEENDISPRDLVPSYLNYSEVQAGKIDDTIEAEEYSIRVRDQELRDEAYDASKPTLKQGAQAAAIGAAAEGGIAFCLGIAKKRKEGKRLSNFTAEDWLEVGIDTTKGTVKGGIRGSAIYAMTNFTATPAAVANALVTAAFGVAAQAYQFREGNITTEDFIINSEVLCLDVSVSAVSALLGQTLIPVPVLGAIIGNVAGMFMYQIAKDYLSTGEQALIKNYRESFAALNKMLEERYQQLIDQLRKELTKFTSMVELAFDPDINIAFDASIALADYVGVPKDQILRSKSDIDNYFMN